MISRIFLIEIWRIFFGRTFEIFKISQEFFEIILRMIASEVARGRRNTFSGQKKKLFYPKNTFSDLKIPHFNQKMTLMTKKYNFWATKYHSEQKNNFTERTIFVQKIPPLNTKSTFFDKVKYLIWTRRVESTAELVKKTNTSQSTCSVLSHSAQLGIWYASATGFMYICFQS